MGLETNHVIPLRRHSRQISIKVAVINMFGADFLGRDNKEDPKEPPFRAKKDVNIAKVLFLGRSDGGGRDYGTYILVELLLTVIGREHFHVVQNGIGSFVYLGSHCQTQLCCGLFTYGFWE